MIQKNDFILFGTDGIRGKANFWPIIPELIVKLGLMIGTILKEKNSNENNYDNFEDDFNSFFNPYVDLNSESGNKTVIIGKDTRISGYMIESAFASGLLSSGVNVIYLGPIPTPAISMMVKSLKADLGVMISASHNKFNDNGIKFFGSNGVKLSREIEEKIEKGILNESWKLSNNNSLGKAIRLDDAGGRYIEYIKSTCKKNENLTGLTVVIDSANGAAYKIAPKLFWEMGASVITIGDKPNGKNINKDFGAIFPEKLIETVKKKNADVGIALDGDADRILIVTKNGQLIGGDQIMALIALEYKRLNKLRGPVVSTFMSNLGLKNFLLKNGIDWVSSKIGDKNVLEKMLSLKSNLGGEESGHIILNEHSMTGDGILAGLQVLLIMKKMKKSLDEIFPIFEKIPQISKSFLTNNNDDEILIRFSKITNELSNEYEVVVRKSGTEPVVRVMIQGPDEFFLKNIMNLIENEYKKIKNEI